MIYAPYDNPSQCSGTPISTILPPPTPPASASLLPQHFGRAIALSDNGSFLIVGAPQECCGESGRYSEGFAYAVTCADAACSSPALLGSGGSTGTYFGDTVALSGDGSFVAIGSYGRGRVGSVQTAACTPAAGLCGPLSFFQPPDGQDFDQFGEALVLDGDGSLLFVGAPGRSSQAGVAYVLACSHDTGACGPDYTLVAADGQPNDRFGGCIGVSGDEALAVGSTVGKLYYTLAPTSAPTASQAATPSGTATRGPAPSPADPPAGGLTPGAVAGLAVAIVLVVGAGAGLAWWQARRAGYLPRACGSGLTRSTTPRRHTFDVPYNPM